jgi:transcriptional regulator with XRE-family HTH domain
MDHVTLESLGSNIKKHRKQIGFTQEQLAAQTELSIQYIGNIERGKTTASITTLVKICNVLEVSPNQLLINATDLNQSALLDEVNTILSGKSSSFVKHILAYIEFLENVPEANKER